MTLRTGTRNHSNSICSFTLCQWRVISVLSPHCVGAAAQRAVLFSTPLSCRPVRFLKHTFPPLDHWDSHAPPEFMWMGSSPFLILLRKFGTRAGWDVSRPDREDPRCKKLTIHCLWTVSFFSAVGSIRRGVKNVQGFARTSLSLSHIYIYLHM